jgi:hypothetical protein
VDPSTLVRHTSISASDLTLTRNHASLPRAASSKRDVVADGPRVSRYKRVIDVRIVHKKHKVFDEKLYQNHEGEEDRVEEQSFVYGIVCSSMLYCVVHFGVRIRIASVARSYKNEVNDNFSSLMPIIVNCTSPI